MIYAKNLVIFLIEMIKRIETTTSHDNINIIKIITNRFIG
jgi:hypothetical protein